MYNINIFEHIQDMCLLHYNIIQWDSEESQLTYEVRHSSFVERIFSFCSRVKLV